MHEDYRHLIRDHVYDKCWSLDITWAEVAQLIDTGQVVEEHDLGEAGVKRFGYCSDGRGRFISSTW